MAEWAAIFGGTGAALMKRLFAVCAPRFRRGNTDQHAANLRLLQDME